MIYVKITRDIRTYKTKMFWGLTARQLICGAIGISTGMVLNTFAKDYIGNDLASWLTIIVEFPIFAIGFVTIQGMTAEKFFKVFIKNKLKNGKIIVFNNDNVYNYIEEAIEEEEKIKFKDKIKKALKKGKH